MREPTSEEWERIETALGLTDQKPERREKILGTLEWVFHLQPREIFGPYIPETFTSEYRRAHLALKRQAKKARNVLDDADWRSADLDALISRIDDIAPDDDKGGRPTNWRLQASIHKLGGSPAYRVILGANPADHSLFSFQNAYGSSRPNY
jgi:hypothetical protein